MSRDHRGSTRVRGVAVRFAVEGLVLVCALLACETNETPQPQPLDDHSPLSLIAQDSVDLDGLPAAARLLDATIADDGERGVLLRSPPILLRLDGRLRITEARNLAGRLKPEEHAATLHAASDSGYWLTVYPSGKRVRIDVAPERLEEHSALVPSASAHALGEVTEVSVRLSVDSGVVLAARTGQAVRFTHGLHQEKYRRAPRAEALFGKVNVAVDSGVPVLATSSGDALYWWREDGRWDSVPLPPRRRRGAPPDFALAIQFADSSRILGPYSSPAFLAADDGVVNVVYVDSETREESSTMRAFLSSLGPSAERLCLDVAIPGPVTRNRSFAMRGDTLFVFWQEPARRSAGVIVAARYLLDRRLCPGRRSSDQTTRHQGAAVQESK